MSSLYESGIRPAFDEFILKKAAERRDYGDYWSASSAGYCMRKNIFDRLGVPAITEDARKHRVFQSGHIFHEFMQRITKEAGLSIAQEIELQDEDLMVRGHIDDLVMVAPYEVPEVYKQGGQADPPEHLILYDYKTQNSRAFTYQKGRDISHFHRLQVGTYLYMLRKEFAVKNKPSKKNIEILETIRTGHATVEEARILKISKDDMRMSEQQLLWTPDLEKDVVSYWRTLNGYWKKKTLPKCTCVDFEGGFMAKEAYNPYFYNGEPCSLEYYQKCKAEGLLSD